MAPSLRKTTRKKTQVSAAAAKQKGFVLKARRTATRNALEKGLTNRHILERLQEVSIANANSPLLRLPSEIRNMIFEYAASSERPLKLWFNRQGVLSRKGASTYTRKAENGFLQLRLHHVCRQLFSEPALAIYQLNAFSFTTLSGLKFWLEQRTTAQLEAIKFIELSDQQFGEFEDWTHLPAIERMIREISCPNLQTLTYDEDHAYWMSETRCIIRNDDPSVLSTNYDPSCELKESCICTYCEIYRL